jgi:hypothetical protein
MPSGIVSAAGSAAAAAAQPPPAGVGAALLVVIALFAAQLLGRRLRLQPARAATPLLASKLERPG